MSSLKKEKVRVSLELDEQLAHRLREKIKAVSTGEKISLNALCSELLLDGLNQMERRERRLSSDFNEQNLVSKNELDTIDSTYQSISDYKSCEQFICQMTHMILSLVTKIFASTNLPEDEKSEYLRMAKKISKYHADYF